MSGVIKCYIEFFERPDGLPDLRLREKVTGRWVRVLTNQLILQQAAPLSNLLQDCFAHGGGLVERTGNKEFLALRATVVGQGPDEIAVSFDGSFSVSVRIVVTNVVSPPASVWCYLDEYQLEGDRLGVRLRQKITGRKIEMYGKNAEHLTRFLASPRFTGVAELMPNLYEKEGFHDYVLVSGATAVDSYDVLRFNDGAELTYLLGPTPDTAYRDAFRAMKDEAAATAHARTAKAHFEHGRYREAVLSARLSVEVACGGRGADVRLRLTGAPSDVSNAGDVLRDKRNIAVHEGDTRVEQQDAREALDAMNVLLDFLKPDHS
ncbi:hypothetical protein SAMN04487847_0452 [Microbacterium sp. cf332]|nr:hypothetical protein SAMN04487847_0452 [Microbacterium sp. cf332]